MYKIGDFSNLSKTTIKTLRYYEQEKLLIPAFIDENGYRYYEAKQLVDLAKIVSLRQIEFSIDEIKAYINGANFNELLENKKKELENTLIEKNNQLSKINYLLEEKNMKYEVIQKELPDYTIYYKEGVIKDFSEITNFILSSANECLKTNPDMKCVEPEYCYVSYLDNEYRDKDIKIRYAQAVVKEGIPNETIKFMKLKPINAVCIYHKGAYETLGEAYGFIMKFIEENGYKITEAPRERYIDGMWNKENVEDWLTEIQVPVAKK